MWKSEKRIKFRQVSLKIDRKKEYKSIQLDFVVKSKDDRGCSMIEQYEVNPSTLALIPLTAKTSRVEEIETSYIVNQSTTEIIDASCRFFGSSYLGRLEGTKTLLGVNYKAPIIIEESTELIFFPTSSPRFDDCYWISIGHLREYRKKDYGSEVLFETGFSLPLNISYGSLQNQVLRATRLQVVLRRRKLTK